MNRPPRLGHALVVGGTGMLAGVARELARQGRIVTVVARHSRSLRRLARSCGDAADAIRPVPLDYHDYELLRRALAERQEADGAFELVICWIHDSAAEGPFVVARTIKRAADGCRSCPFIHVIASASENPMQAARRWATELERQSGISYRQVVLGFRRAGSRSRWLHDEEIATGVSEAISSEEGHRLIGTTSPWEDRP